MAAHVEVLEDRTLLSAITVNMTADDAILRLDTPDTNTAGVDLVLDYTGSTADHQFSVPTGDTLTVNGTGNDNTVTTLLSNHNINQTYDGAAGTDELRLSVTLNEVIDNAADIAADLALAQASPTGPVTLTNFFNFTIQNFESVKLSVFNGGACSGVIDNIIIGTNYSEVLTGTSGNDLILGRGGHDTINGLGGCDVIFGEGGFDTLNGGNGDDTFAYLPGNNGYDVLNGGDGYDVAKASGANVVFGVNGYDNGVDEFQGDTGGTVVRDFNYSRTLDFSNTTLTNISEVDAGGGHDTIIASDLSAGSYRGGSGFDSLTAGTQDVTWLYSGTNNDYDTFHGNTTGNTVIAVASDSNVVFGVNGYNNGVDEFQGDTGGTVVRDFNYSRTLDFSNTTLTNISEVDAAGGHDTVTTSLLSRYAGLTYDGATGFDQLRLSVTLDEVIDNAAAIAADLALAQASPAGPVALTNFFNFTVQNFESVKLSVFNEGSHLRLIDNMILGTPNHDTTSPGYEPELDGTNLNDLILGFGGDDVINGDGGDDIIIGGIGQDHVNGGANDDIFVYRGNGEGYDTIDGGTGDNRIVAVGAGTVISVRHLNNGSETIQKIEGSIAGDTIVRSSHYVHSVLNFTNVELVNIVEIDAAGATAGNNIYVSTVSDAVYRGNGGMDVFHLQGDKNVTLPYSGPSHGFDSFSDTGFTGTAIAVAETTGTVIGLRHYDDALDAITGHSSGDTIIEASDSVHDNLNFTNTQLTGIALIKTGGGDDVVTTSLDHDANLTYDGETYTHDQLRLAITPNEAVNNASAIAADVAAIEAAIASNWSSGAIALSFFKFSVVNFESVKLSLFNGGACSGVIDNIIIGTNYSEVLTGTSGNDLILGRGGHDTINGLGGCDVIFGEGGFDALNGGDGDDTFAYLPGSNGYDVLNGGNGDDVAKASGANVVFGVNGYNNGVEEFQGDIGGDTIVRDYYYSRTLDFSNTTLTNISEVDAGGGHDTVIASDLSAGSYRGGSGNDSLTAGTQDVTWLYSGTNNDYDTFHGNTAGDGVSVIAKASGANVVFGVNGYDNGVDEFQGDAGGDTVVRDYYYSRTLDFSDTTLTDIAEISGAGGHDTIIASDISAASYRGGSGNDSLTAGTQDVTWLYSGTNNDYDTFHGNTAGDGVSVIAKASGANVVFGVNGYDNGVDEFQGDAGGDTVVRDYYYSRTLDFSDTTLTDIAEVDAGGGHDTIIASDLSAASYRGGSGNDSLTAGSQNVTWLYSGTNNDYDTFHGNTAGVSVIAKASGANVVFGVNGYNNGVDEFQGDASGDTVVRDYYYSRTLDFSDTTLTNIAEVNAGGGHDTVTTSLLSRDAGLTYDGATGFDQLRLSVTLDEVIDNAAAIAADLALAQGNPTGPVTLTHFFNFTVKNFESVKLSVFNEGSHLGLIDNMILGTSNHDDGASAPALDGTNQNDLILGFGGHDVIDGNGGDDILIGGVGYGDILNGGSDDDTFIYRGAGGGYNTIDGGTGNNRIVAVGAGTVIGVRNLNAGPNLTTTIQQIVGSSSGDTIVHGGIGIHNILNFTDVELVNIAEIEGGGATSHDIIYVSQVSDAHYRGGGNNDVFHLQGDKDVTFLYSGTGNGFDSFKDNSFTGHATAVAETANTVIGIVNFNEVLDEINGHSSGDTVIQASSGVHDNLDFSNTQLTDIALVETGGGNDTVTTSLNRDAALTYDGGGYSGDQLRLTVTSAEASAHAADIAADIALIQTAIANGWIGGPLALSFFKFSVINFESVTLLTV